MNFILLLMFGYLFLKYRDMSKMLDDYIARVDALEDMEDKEDV